MSAATHPAVVAWNQPQAIFNKWAWLCANTNLFIDTEIWISCDTKYYHYFGLSTIQKCKYHFQFANHTQSGSRLDLACRTQFANPWSKDHRTSLHKGDQTQIHGQEHIQWYCTGRFKISSLKGLWLYLILSPIFPEKFIKLVSVLVREGHL